MASRGKSKPLAKGPVTTQVDSFRHKDKRKNIPTEELRDLACGAARVDNGLLLRLDIHRLFDRGYVTVDRDYRFVVSRRLKEEFDNGRTYYEFHGREIVVPDRFEERPSAASIGWHNEHVFRE